MPGLTEGRFYGRPEVGADGEIGRVAKDADGAQLVPWSREPV
jgi:hypothetical protein